MTKIADLKAGTPEELRMSLTQSYEAMLDLLEQHPDGECAFLMLASVRTAEDLAHNRAAFAGTTMEAKLNLLSYQVDWFDQTGQLPILCAAAMLAEAAEKSADG